MEWPSPSGRHCDSCKIKSAQISVIAGNGNFYLCKKCEVIPMDSDPICYICKKSVCGKDKFEILKTHRINNNVIREYLFVYCDQSCLQEGRKRLKTSNSEDNDQRSPLQRSASPYSPNTTFYCKICQEKAVQMCAICIQAYYCGADCQRSDWQSHKQTCRKYDKICLKN